jgi:calcium-translocating P-type ATPase
MTADIAPMTTVSLETLLSFNVPQAREANKKNFDDYGGIEKLINELGSDITKGMTTEKAQSSRAHYGENVFPTSPMKSFLELYLASFEDTVLIVLIVAAVVSITVSTIQNPTEGWLEGTAILIAVQIVALVTASNDYSKELQFRALEQSAQSDERCSIIRDGSIIRVNPAEVCIGDVIVMQAGDQIAADCIIVDPAVQIFSNEAALTGEPEDLKKALAKDPFLISSCLMTEGDDCKAIVIGIGEFSQWGKIKANLVTAAEPTPLQLKLEDMTLLVGYIGTAVAVVTFLALIIRIWVPEPQADIAGAFISAFIISVTVIVVAIPEGLPLAVTIALAYSTMKMFNDKCLIRVMAACETMGNATTICSDKTGTLTENQMTVVQGFFCNEILTEEVFAQLAKQKEKISAPLKDIIASHACINRTAYLVHKAPDGSDLHRPMCVGNKTEGALINMARSWGFDEEKLKGEMFKEGRDKTFPFNSKKKRSTTVVTLANGAVRVYCKGATEWIMKDCSTILNSDGKATPLTETRRAEIDRIIFDMADQALRTLTLAHKDFASMNDLPSNWQDNPPDDKDLTIDCIVGIIDPLRSDVKEAVATAQRAGVTVRMVTGDNIATAKAIARQCGILTDHGVAVEGPVFRHMTPAEVDKILLKVQVMGRSSPEDKFLMVTRLNGFNLPKNEEDWLKAHKDKPNKTWAEHRDLILPGYKEEWDEARPTGGQVVGVTGDGTNDAPALKAADVGLSMGITGTKVAQDASDIVILDDKFSSIVKAILWGRSVYDNICKFLQFQLTVNVVALVVVFVGAASGYGEPLKAVQMLWVNLIMDTMGALALATESPTPELLDRKPFRKTASLLSRPMLRNIGCQSIFQLILCFVLLFDGQRLFDLEHSMSLNHGEGYCRDYFVQKDGGEYSKSGSTLYCDTFKTGNFKTAPNRFGDYKASDEALEDYMDLVGMDHKYHSAVIAECEAICQPGETDLEHKTIFFNTFIFCQVFNEYTARSIGDEWNVFDGLFTNPVFMGVSIVTVVLQFILVQYCGLLFSTQPLNVQQWFITIALGAIGLIVGVLMRFIPCEQRASDFFDDQDPDIRADYEKVAIHMKQQAKGNTDTELTSLAKDAPEA